MYIKLTGHHYSIAQKCPFVNRSIQEMGFLLAPLDVSTVILYTLFTFTVFYIYIYSSLSAYANQRQRPESPSPSEETHRAQPRNERKAPQCHESDQKGDRIRHRCQRAYPHSTANSRQSSQARRDQKGDCLTQTLETHQAVADSRKEEIILQKKKQGYTPVFLLACHSPYKQIYHGRQLPLPRLGRNIDL